MKGKLILFVIVAFVVQCYSDLDHMVRIQGGTDGVGPGYRLLVGHFSVSGNGMLKCNMNRLFSDTDSNNFNSFQLTPELELGVSIKTKKGRLIVPFVGVAIPTGFTNTDSTGDFFFDEYFRVGSDYFLTRDSLPFFNIGAYISINNTGVFGIEFRLGITVLHKNKEGIRKKTFEELRGVGNPSL